MGSESHAHAARLKNMPSPAIGSLDASFAAGATQRRIDCRVSGSRNANKDDLVPETREEIGKTNDLRLHLVSSRRNQRYTNLCR